MVIRGSLLVALMRLALPAVGSMLLNSAFGLVDAFWVGRLGPDAMASMSAASYFLWSTYALVSLVSVGTHAHVARRAGEGDFGRCASAAGEGLLLCVPVSALAVAFYMTIAADSLAFMGTTGDVLVMARDYLDVILVGLPVTMIFMVVGAVFQGTGDTRTPFWLLTGGFVINGVLDPVLIYGVGSFDGLGLEGAAIATVGSQALATIPGLIILISRRLIEVPRPLVAKRMLSILRIGLPMFIEGFLFCVVYVILVKMLLPYGVWPLAALGVGHRLEGLDYMVALGFSHATAVMVGQSLGAGNPVRAARGAWLATGMAGVFAVLVTLVFMLWPGGLIAVFVPESNTVVAGASYLRIVGLSQLFMTVEVCLLGGFTGAGNTFPPMMVSAGLTLARVPLAYLLCTEAGWGTDGVFWAISLTTIAKGIMMALWFSLGRWKKHTL